MRLASRAQGTWLAAHLVESKAWAMYRERRKQFASLIGDREPIALKRQLPGMGRAMRYIITIADDDRRLLQNLCRKLSATDVACAIYAKYALQTLHGTAVPDTLNSSGLWLGCAVKQK
jgi:hypothetical protein